MFFKDLYMSKATIKPFNMDTQEQQEDINNIEKQKLNLRPIDFYKELDTLYMDSLGKGDRYYLQDFGIYNNELTDDEFMLRLTKENINSTVHLKTRIFMKISPCYFPHQPFRYLHLNAHLICSTCIFPAGIGKSNVQSTSPVLLSISTL